MASDRSSAGVRVGAAAAQRGGGHPAGVGVRQVGGQVDEGPQQRGAGAVRGLGGPWPAGGGGDGGCGGRDGHGGALPRTRRWPRGGDGAGRSGPLGARRRASVGPLREARTAALALAARARCGAGDRAVRGAGRAAVHRCGAAPDSHRLPLRATRLSIHVVVLVARTPRCCVAPAVVAGPGAAGPAPLGRAAPYQGARGTARQAIHGRVVRRRQDGAAGPVRPGPHRAGWSPPRRRGSGRISANPPGQGHAPASPGSGPPEAPGSGAGDGAPAPTGEPASPTSAV